MINKKIVALNSFFVFSLICLVHADQQSEASSCACVAIAAVGAREPECTVPDLLPTWQHLETDFSVLGSASWQQGWRLDTAGKTPCSVDRY